MTTIKLYILVNAVFAVMLSAMSAFGAWTDDPTVNVPICTADGIQEHPRITTDGAIIVWQDM